MDSGALLGPWADLLKWDASFLPVVEVDDSGADIQVHTHAPGVSLDAVRRWPRQARVGVASQMVAAATFLFDQGWFPSRSLLRSVRAVRQSDGVWVRLSGLPRLALHGPTLRRLGRRLPSCQRLVADLLAPLLAEIVPEGVTLTPSELDGSGPSGLLEALERIPRSGKPWNHPAGLGRFLWARRLSLPHFGVVWVEDGEEALLTQLRAAAMLAAVGLDRRIAVAAGHLDEQAVNRFRTQLAVQDQDCLILTPIPVMGAFPLGLASAGIAVWGLAPAGLAVQQHLDRAVMSGRARAALAGDVLAAGAGDAFTSSPQQVATQRCRRCDWLSPAAREAQRWLEQAPAGLTADELDGLRGGAGRNLAELERLGLAWREGETWRAINSGAAIDLSLQKQLAAGLPDQSPRRMLAMALATDDVEPLAKWCDQALEKGLDRLVQEYAGAVPGQRRLLLLAAEAALGRGRLREAASFLGNCHDPADPGTWWVLEAWRADRAGETARLTAALESAAGAPVTGRLRDRITILRAEQARRHEKLPQAMTLLARVERAGGRCSLEAGLLRAAMRGPAELRRLRRRLSRPAPPGLLAYILFLRSAISFGRGHWPAVATGLRAALRLWGGDNFLLLADIHGDLGTALGMLDHYVAAERHLQLAEQLYNRCGSRRDHTVVRPNRAVLACDRLELDLAQELIAAARGTRGEVEDASYWLDEAELARVAVARGDLEAVRRRIDRIETSTHSTADHPRIAQSLAVVRAHLALAEGNLEAAGEWAPLAEDGERRLIRAVIDAARGTMPEEALPVRWGMALTAAALAALEGGDSERARAFVEEGLRHSPRETAMGLARLAGISARRGGDLPRDWDSLKTRAAAVLEEGGLAWWRRYLRRGGDDLAAVVSALGELLGQEAPLGDADAWKRVGRALGLSGMEIRIENRSILTFGDKPVCCAAAMGSLEIHCAPEPDSGGKAVLEFLAARLPLSLPGLAPGAHPRAGATLIGSSDAMGGVRESIAGLAPLAVTVLILGEPGTGKELVARELHRSSGRSGPWEALNCAALPEGLLESELFGVARGAYTGADRDRPGLVEATDGGTLFLDEIGELPISLQAKLLRVLQHREVRRVGAVRSRKVDVRFLAATNRDLLAALSEGSFRRDLYDRLSVFQIELPPLRERPEDTAELAQVLVERFSEEFRRPGIRVSAAALALLGRQPWPGNVRELESVLIRAVVGSRPGEVLEERHFAELTSSRLPESRVSDGWPAAQRAFARQYFEEVLQSSGGNRTRAAEMAGITRQALLYQLRRLGLDSG